MCDRTSTQAGRAWPHAWLSGLGFLAVLVYTCYAAMGKNVFSRPWCEGCVDYRIIYDCSWCIVENHAYLGKHAYPPSAITIHYGLAQLPFEVSAAVYMALTIMATLACCWLLLRFFPDASRPGWLILAVPAFIAAQHYILWDLRAQNCNVIFCATVLAGVYALHRDRPIGAGFWLSLSFSLKLFSVALIPYLLWRGNLRAFAWACAFLLLFWLALPLAVFGGPGLTATYQDWLRQISDVGAERADITHTVLISLHNAAHLLFNGDAHAEAYVVTSFRAVWLAVVIAAACCSLRRRTDRADGYGLLADVAVLVLAPIAVSPYLEPYHATPFIIPAFLLLASAADGGQGRRLRIFSLAVFLLLVLVRTRILAFQYRGLSVNLALLLATSATIWIALKRKKSLVSDHVPVEPARTIPQVQTKAA